jgi:hypothetical protein
MAEVDARVLAAATLSLLASSFAGCVGSDSAANPPGGPLQDDSGVFISGVVVDSELVPIGGVTVVDSVAELVVLTDDGGAFSLGPVLPGKHHLTAEKAGYASGFLTVEVLDEPIQGVRLTIEPIASSVPFYETVPHVTFVYCWIAFGSNLPCTKLVDYAAGTNVSGEETFAFTFHIPYDNLSDILFEVTWNAQSLGRDMRFYVQTPPNQALTAATQKYFRMIGSSPLRGWMIANVINPGYGPNGTVLFDATPQKVLYEASTVSSNTNSTLPGNAVAVFLNIRCETWMTSFYNRAGSREFSAIPDA